MAFTKEDVIYCGEVYDIYTDIADLMTWNSAYRKGYREPNYPVPVIPLHVQITPEVDDPFHDSIVIRRIIGTCECCGGPWVNVYDFLAVWDFDIDRCQDYFLPYGEYCNSRMIEEGIAACFELQDLGSRVQ